MTRDEVVTKRISEAGPLYKAIMVKAYAGEGSPRQAIKAQCLSCVGYDREAVTHCSGFSCPLWAFRPYQTAGADE